MSFDREIGAPFTLASLPHSTGSGGRRAQAASVCSISGTRKRKRTEIAVGVDGEGILIYSLQNPQLVTSYALPPQTSFASAPYSIYRKGSTKRPPRRYTYAFVSQSTASTKPQLVCFAEESRKDTTTETAKTSYTLSRPTKAVVIDSAPIPAGGSQRDTSHDVLVVLDDGEVICLSADLEAVRWTVNLRSLSAFQKAEFEVEYASLSTAKSVLHGLLKGRADIAALLNPSLDDASDLLDLLQVLCVISRRPDGIGILELFQLQPRSPDLPASHLSQLKHLVAWELPSPQSTTVPASARRHYSLHVNNGSLHLLAECALISYDFSGAVPKVHSELSAPALEIDSFVRISQNILFASSRGYCRILDVKYNSIQGQLSIGPNSSSSKEESKKRKHAEPRPVDDPSTAPGLAAYYADLRLAVGTWHNELVGFQLGETVTRKRAKAESVCLIDSLGRGIASKPARSGAVIDKKERYWQKWPEKIVKLDKYASKGKISKFEALLAADLGIELEAKTGVEEGNPQSKSIDGVQDMVTTNGMNEGTPDSHGIAQSKTSEDSAEDQPQKWRLPKSVPDTQGLLFRHHALYALSKIFRWTSSPNSQATSQGSLSIDFFPPNVFQWLLQSGYLTKESIRRAILDYSPDDPSTASIIRDGDIVRAIVEFDPELHILSAVLNHSQFLPVGEVVQAIKLLMQTLHDSPKAEDTTHLLTNGTEPSIDAMDLDLDRELEAATHEIDRALSILDNGLIIRSNVLRPALIRLHTFPAPVISSTLRSMLPRPGLESLIRLLHHEFKNGGWTSAYDFADPEVAPVEPPSQETDDSAVAVIASLLSCTLDAIGPTTWVTTVGGSTNEDSRQELIDDLLQDASVALNGFWEATYIRGLISELLRYASRLSKSQKPSNKTLQNQGKPFAPDLNLGELPMLPLGAKPDLGIEKTKGRKRGERSAREIGMLISRRVPKYSFERIVI